MNKYLLIFCVGILETAIYTGFLLALERRQQVLAPILMTIYMSIYLTVIGMAIKNVDTIPLLLVYAVSCGIGVAIRMRIEKRLR
jgi:uncharacterized protein YebE (UPF0316 family)